MRTHFLFKYFRPKIVLKIAYFRYLTYQGKQKMFFSVLHFMVRNVEISAGRGVKFPSPSSCSSSGLGASLGCPFRNMQALRDKRRGKR